MSEVEMEETVAATIEAAAAETAMIEAAAVTAKMEVVTETAMAVMTGNAVADSNDGGNAGS
jgi:hypothetical protein